MITVKQIYTRGAQACGAFLSVDLDAGIEGEVTGRRVVWHITEDGGLEISHIEIASESKRTGVKLAVEVADNGYVVSTKNKMQLCITTYDIQTFIERESVVEHLKLLPVDGVGIECDEAIEAFLASHP